MRPSTETAIETGVSYLVILVVGLFLMLGGGAGVLGEYRPGPAHTTHLFLFGGVSVFGAFVLLIGIGKKMGTTIIQTIVVIATPFVPKFGGQRAGDPPAPGGTP